MGFGIHRGACFAEVAHPGLAHLETSGKYRAAPITGEPPQELGDARGKRDDDPSLERPQTDGSTQQSTPPERHDPGSLLGQLLIQELVFSGSEGTFAVTLEDLPNRHSRPPGDLFV